jgi:hypothetical protein
VARTLQLSGKRPGTTRREDPINTATTSADSTTPSRDVECDAATVRSLVRIRELGPGDSDVVVVDEVFAGLSPRSRYLSSIAGRAVVSAPSYCGPLGTGLPSWATASSSARCSR